MLYNTMNVWYGAMGLSWLSQWATLTFPLFTGSQSVQTGQTKQNVFSVSKKDSCENKSGALGDILNQGKADLGSNLRVNWEQLLLGKPTSDMVLVKGMLQ